MLFRSTIKNDLDSVKVFFSSRDNLNDLPNLKPGQFSLLGNIASKPKVIKFRDRETQHEAEVPEISKSREPLSKNLKDIKIGLGEKEKENGKELIAAIEPKVSKEQALEKMKRKTRKLGIFGKGKEIQNLRLILRPIYECKVKYLSKKLLSEEYRTTYLYLDGVTGNLISIRNGYKILSESKELIGLRSKDLRIFKNVKRKNRMSTSEVASEKNLSKTSARNSLKRLVKENLLESNKEGKKLIYSPFTKIELPKIEKIGNKGIDTEKKSVSGKKEKSKIEEDVKNFIEGMDKESKLVNKEKIYYPFYKGEIERKNSKKETFVDGLNRKLLENTKLT